MLKGLICKFLYMLVYISHILFIGFPLKWFYSEIVVVVVVCLFPAQSYKHYKNQNMIYNNK